MSMLKHIQAANARRGRAIRQLFESRPHEWIPLYEFKPITRAPQTVFASLKKALLMNIENHEEVTHIGKRKVVHSSYRYTPPASGAAQPEVPPC